MIPKEVFEQTILEFFEPIAPYLANPTVSEIMINSPSEILVERHGRIERTPAKFSSREALLAGLRNIAQYVGRHFDGQRQILEARLPDGSRVEAIMPPAAADGPVVAIRRFARETLTMQKLLAFGALTPDLVQVLAALVGGKQNIIVAGGTASGKTSFLNALGSFIPSEERVVVIEDNRELQLQQSHLVQLEAQPPDPSGRGAVSIRDLFTATLRMRPDRIVVGEVRGGEALDLIQAMTSGHSGCLSTVHATHPLDTLHRIETMALMSDVRLPLSALRAQVASAVNFIVQVSRLADGSRCVTHLTEVVGHDERGYILRDLFLRSYGRRRADGTIVSELTPTGNLPTAIEYLRGMGHDLPESLFGTKEAS